jgi:hypothetical protein
MLKKLRREMVRGRWDAVMKEDSLFKIEDAP